MRTRSRRATGDRPGPTKIIRAAAALIVLLCLAVVFAGCGNSRQGASPARVAGEYVKGLAQNAGVKIVGDKVWSVRTLSNGVTVVVVRVRFEQELVVGITPTGAPVTAYSPPQVITLYVRLVKSGYTVVG